MKFFLLITLFLFSCKSNLLEGMTHTVDSNGKKKFIVWELKYMNSRPVKGPSLIFGEGNFSAFGGCNSGSGKFQRNDSEIRFFEVVVSTKACEPKEILLIESEFFKSIHEVHSFEWFYEKDQLDLRGEKTLLSFKKRLDYIDHKR